MGERKRRDLAEFSRVKGIEGWFLMVDWCLSAQSVYAVLAAFSQWLAPICGVVVRLFPSFYMFMT